MTTPDGATTGITSTFTPPHPPPPVPGPASPPPQTGPPGGQPPATDAKDPQSTPPPSAAEGSEASSDDPQPIGSGEGVDEVTRNFGEGSRRGEYLRNAGRIIKGDAVGGDLYVNIYAAERNFRLNRVSSVLLGSARDSFVPPRDWEDTLIAGAKRRIVVLRGAVGHGRTTAGLRILQGAQSEPVYHLGSSDLADLGEILLAADHGDTANGRKVHGAGFLLDEAAEIATLRASSLRGIEAALHNADARLVIVVGSAEPIREQSLLDLVVDLADGPDHRAVLAAHLRRRLAARHVDELVARAELGELLDDHLADGTPCADIVRLAEFLADGELSGRTDPGRIRDQMSQRDAAGFETWFAQLPDTETRCHAVALAVLGGTAQETVARAARSLFQRLDRSPDIIVPASARDEFAEHADPFRLGQSALLSLLQARAVPTILHGPYGPAPAQTVVYRDGKYPPAVLGHVWEQHRIHDDLLAWLAELAASSQEQVRIQAGLALGAVAVLSFDYVCRTVLVPWARSNDPKQREAVAYAFHVIAGAPELLANVRALTSGWYRNGRPQEQATAARIHGLCLGALDPEASADALMRLMSVQELRVALAVGQALADLVVDGTPDVAGSILAQLLELVDDHHAGATAQLTFLQLAVQPVVDRPGSDPAAGRGAPAVVQWPLLLAMTDDGQIDRTYLVRLWRRVLGTAAHFHAEAEAVFTAWALTAQADPALRDALLRLARAIADGDERCSRVLRRLAETWISPENLTPMGNISTALQRVILRDSI